jgi:hypothetical protein
MLKQKILDKTTKDQYQMIPLSYMMLGQGWKQYKNHPVFYKENNTTTNIPIVMIPKTNILATSLTEQLHYYQADLIAEYMIVNNSKSLDYTKWYQYLVLPSVWDKLEDCLLYSTIQLYIEGGCYTEAIKCCNTQKEIENHCLNNAKYFVLNNTNKKYVKILNKIDNCWFTLEYNYKRCINAIKNAPLNFLKFLNKYDVIGKALDKYINEK